MFKALGVAVIGYVLYALAQGEVYGKHGVWGRTFVRDQEPFRYWSTLVVYALLSVALIFWF